MRKPKGVKEGTKKPSGHCPPFCDGIGCYEQLIRLKLGHKKIWIWELHCKSSDRVTNKVLKGLFKWK